MRTTERSRGRHHDIVYVGLGTSGAIAPLNQSAKTTEPPIPVAPKAS